MLLLLACAAPSASTDDTGTPAAGARADAAHAAYAHAANARAARNPGDLAVADSFTPAIYTLQGVGPHAATPAAIPFEVDDDLVVYLNDVMIFNDADRHLTTLEPFSFRAHVGDVLRIVATDTEAIEATLPALQLTRGGFQSQLLGGDICLSDAEADPCYDPTYTPARPEVFYDESFVIGIP